MKLSLTIGFGMLAGKALAYHLTGSSAILSDAAESVIHVAAVGFATMSLRVSHRPADARYRYGYERIAFFSAGFEGALIILAAAAIISSAIQKWLGGVHLEQLGVGTMLVAAAGAFNGVLGLYLIRTGKRTGSLILIADGKHVLTDCWTSVGVVGGLLLVISTGWAPFDPILAILVALNILYSGAGLLRQSITGLMDYSDPALEARLQRALAELTAELGIQHHALRFRHTGQRVLAEVHLLFPFETPVGRAHAMATLVEESLPKRVPFELEVVTHLEAVEDHERVHHTHAMP
ncbi:MAG: cation diffusion facilitator family transporter [Vicinamibacterales bacterium]